MSWRQCCLRGCPHTKSGSKTPLGMHRLLLNQWNWKYHRMGWEENISSRRTEDTLLAKPAVWAPTCSETDSYSWWLLFTECHQPTSQAEGVICFLKLILVFPNLSVASSENGQSDMSKTPRVRVSIQFEGRRRAFQFHCCLHPMGSVTSVRVSVRKSCWVHLDWAALLRWWMCTVLWVFSIHNSSHTMIVNSTNSVKLVTIYDLWVSSGA